MTDLDNKLIQARDKLAQYLDSVECWDQVVSKAAEMVVNSRAEMVVNLVRLNLLGRNQEQVILSVLDQVKMEAQDFLHLRPRSHSLLLNPPELPLDNQ